MDKVVRPAGWIRRIVNSPLARCIYLRDSYNIPNIHKFEYDMVREAMIREDGNNTEAMARRKERWKEYEKVNETNRALAIELNT